MPDPETAALLADAIQRAINSLQEAVRLAWWNGFWTGLFLGSVAVLSLIVALRVRR